jgi:hypothetical protein
MHKVSLQGPKHFSSMDECIKYSVGGGQNVPVFTAYFFVLGDAIFRREAKARQSL